MANPEPKDLARTQALCWLLDELFDAEDDLLEVVARPEALSRWRRERVGGFCQRVGEECGSAAKPPPNSAVRGKSEFGKPTACKANRPGL
jgi:hypothetical protein